MQKVNFYSKTLDFTKSRGSFFESYYGQKLVGPNGVSGGYSSNLSAVLSTGDVAPDFLSK